MTIWPTVSGFRAFLVAGAGAVVATLWRVDDLATGLLIGKLFDLLAGQARPSLADALRQAQRWLRTEVTVARVVHALDTWIDEDSNEPLVAWLGTWSSQRDAAALAFGRRGGLGPRSTLRDF